MSENTPPESDPKIIVDDDWKSQVEKEKQQLKEENERQPEPTPEPESQMPLPQASFMILMSTLGTQAFASMGLLPDPVSGKPTVNLPMAKHFIDTLVMLQEKTKGNLTDEESAQLRDALHQLRMQFVSASSSSLPAKESSPASPSIELP